MPLEPSPPKRQTFGFACWTGPADAMRVAHVHDEVELNLALSAPVHYLIGGRIRTLRAGQLGVFWASTPHQLIDDAPDTRLIWMTIPLDMFLSWNPPQPLLDSLFRNEIATSAGDHDHDLDRAIMMRWAAELGTSPANTEIVALEARAAVHRLALRVQADTEVVSGGLPGHRTPRFATTAVTVMAGYLAREFRRPIRVADVAAAAHLGPQHAMKLFHQVVGFTIGGYLQQCRIAEAQRLLLTSDAPVTRIALDSGFGSLSRFHAAFKEAVGTTPARYRRIHDDLQLPDSAVRT